MTHEEHVGHGLGRELAADDLAHERAVGFLALDTVLIEGDEEIPEIRSGYVTQRHGGSPSGRASLKPYVVYNDTQDGRILPPLGVSEKPPP